ncbi:hypothetical protein CEXT_296411 [Caerostris extrusa]|uniref:Uncharacterized protein n=1 Tax=Caerostris extrusa TaxID=172846 RepID=A0AAV4U9U7_CAEEX|nr:hypothetical protein CEXT_296411 [Caerostris extrusa]
MVPFKSVLRAKDLLPQSSNDRRKRHSAPSVKRPLMMKFIEISNCRTRLRCSDLDNIELYFTSNSVSFDLTASWGRRSDFWGGHLLNAVERYLLVSLLEALSLRKLSFSPIILIGLKLSSCLYMVKAK